MNLENIPVHLNNVEHRFEMNVNGGLAVINYKQSMNTIYLVHTEVPERLEGQGIAAALVEKTLRYLEEHHLKLVPLCSYVQHYLHKHPEWMRLVANEE